jgi:hypothetical protein
MNELEIQTKIVEAARKDRGYAIKMQNRHLAGVPDLLVSFNGTGPALIEVKISGSVLKLTPLQRITLQKMRLSGVMCGWLACELPAPGEMVLHVGTDFDAVSVKQSVKTYYKSRGEAIPIKEIVKMITHAAW